jgi:hypothetical protein
MPHAIENCRYLAAVLSIVLPVLDRGRDRVPRHPSSQIPGLPRWAKGIPESPQVAIREIEAEESAKTLPSILDKEFPYHLDGSVPVPEFARTEASSSFPRHRPTQTPDDVLLSLWLGVGAPVHDDVPVNVDTAQ